MARSKAPTAYPLTWPDGWPRSAETRGSQFRTGLSGALKNVNDELQRFANDSDIDVTDIMISSNVCLGNQSPEDPGVAVYFSWHGVSTCIPVDRYPKVQDNLQAISLVIEAERTKMRHGGLNLVRAAFRGYAALPPPTSPASPWWRVLGISEDASPATIDTAYRKLRSKHHPDKGGDRVEFDRVTKAYEQATA